MLIELTKFAGLFFASAGFTAGGDGGGAGDAGAGDGVGDGGGTATEVLDAPADDAPPVDDPDALPADDAPPDDPDAPKIDGRTAADAIKKGLSKLKEIDPNLAQEFRKQFFKQEGELRQFREVYKTPAEARAVAELASLHGGAEGIAKNAADAEQFADELRGFAEGRTELIDMLVKDYPDALPKLAGYGLQQLKRSNPEAYGLEASKIISSTLSEKGVLSTLAELDRIVNEGGPNAQRDAARLSKVLSDWFKGTEQYAKSQPETSKDDPREKALSEREKGISTKEQEIYNGQVNTAALTRINSVLKSSMEQYMKGKTLNDKQKGGFYKDAFTNVAEALKVKPGYIERYNALYKKGNIQELARFVENSVKQVSGAAVKDAWAARGFSAAAPTAPRPGTRTAAVQVGEKPSVDQVDWSKDRDRARFMGEANGGVTGEATLRDGTVRRWKW